MTMEAQDVLQVLELLEEAGVPTTLDGGWGVDALLGAQYRDHEDVDLVIDLRDVRPAIEVLGDAGYTVVDNVGTEELRLDDGADHVIDLRGVHTDGIGNRWLASHSPAEDPPDMPVEYHTYGWIGGRQVSCLSPEYQALRRLARELTPQQVDDVRRLGERFATPVPADLRRV